MPWISVYDTVDGPKLRDLYKSIGCSKFEALGILNFLWFWGLTNADKEGRILSADKEDISRHLYGVGAGSKLDTMKVVDALLETGWIDQVSGGIYIHDWETWQEQWYKAIERRESDAKRKREIRKRNPQDSYDSEEESRDAHEIKGARDSPPDNPKDSPQDNPQDESPEKEPPDESPEEPKYAKAFDEFWRAYPRKIGKGEAYKKYQARRKDGYSDDELLIAAKNYALNCKKMKTEPQYIKHAKTFLSDSLPFDDFIPKQDEMRNHEPKGENPFGEFGGDK